MGPWAMAAQAGTGLLAGVLSSRAKKKALNRQIQMMKEQIDKSLALYDNVSIPKPEDLAVVYNDYKLDDTLRKAKKFYAGKLGDTELANINVDKNIIDKENETLNNLSEIAREGYTAREKADLYENDLRSKQYEKGQRDAILQNMQARGVGGSGAELAAVLASQQGGANREAQRGLEVAAMAKQRALDALLQQANVANRMHSQQYDEQSDEAKARDAINQFNYNQSIAAQQENQRREQEAAKNRQAIAQANENARREQQRVNNENLMKITAQQKALADAKAHILMGDKTPQAVAQKGQADADLYAGLGTAVNQGISDWNKKKGI